MTPGTVRQRWHKPAVEWQDRFMVKTLRVIALAGLTCALLPVRSYGVELKVSRDALERTLKQQLFSGPQGRYYLKGSARSACYVYAENPQVRFAGSRIVVQVKTHARLGTSLRGACLGISLTPESEVSVAPDGEGETLGFKDARLERVSEQKELNFLLTAFLGHTVPASMKVNAADLLRKALTDSTATSGYKVTLDRLKIHSIQIDQEELVVDADGDISVK
jgi:hypothetical protein